MARCLNCIHFEVCNQDRREYERIFGKCVEFLNEDDVVPKSEVEELIKSVDDMLDLVCSMTGLELTYYGKYAELRKKYTEDQSDG